DGSLIPDQGVGAAAIAEQESRWIRIGSEREHSIFEAELMGLELATNILEINIQNKNYKEIAIFSDNQAALRTIAKPPAAKSGQHITTQIFNTLKELKKQCKINLIWTPSHVGIEENDQVDEMAKRATTDQGEDTNKKIPINLSMQLKKIKDE
ncbi:ribonuclease H-like domain-containing protein, partial [Melampsora americana]